MFLFLSFWRFLTQVEKRLLSFNPERFHRASTCISVPSHSHHQLLENRYALINLAQKFSNGDVWGDVAPVVV